MRREAALATLSVCLTIIAASAIIARGGPLDPPAGPVESTFKTLDQVEPRTPIDVLPFTITESGSYYVTGDLAGLDGVLVLVPDVTIDLMGCTLTALGGPSPHGVALDGLAVNCVIRNGSLNAWSIAVNAEDAESVVIEDVRINGAVSEGVNTGPNALVRNCTVRNAVSGGVTIGAGSVAENLIITSCGVGLAAGVDARVDSCLVSNSTGVGVILGEGAVAANTSAVGGDADGFSLGLHSTADRCTARANGAAGFYVNSHATLANSTSSQNLSYGVHVAGSMSRVESTTVRSNGASGLLVTGVDNDIVGNTSIDNRGSQFHISDSGNLFIANRAIGLSPFNLQDNVYAGPLINLGEDDELTDYVGADHPKANLARN